MSQACFPVRLLLSWPFFPVLNNSNPQTVDKQNKSCISRHSCPLPTCSFSYFPLLKLHETFSVTSFFLFSLVLGVVLHFWLSVHHLVLTTCTESYVHFLAPDNTLTLIHISGDSSHTLQGKALFAPSSFEKTVHSCWVAVFYGCTFIFHWCCSPALFFSCTNLYSYQSKFTCYWIMHCHYFIICNNFRKILIDKVDSNHSVWE